MTPSIKKERKSAAKQAKKAAKLEQKAAKRTNGATPAAAGTASGPSPAVRYAEFVRGVLSVILGVSIVAALVLGQRGAIVSLNDIIDSLFAARAGKVVLGLIALALIIYGLKYVRVVR